MSRKTRFTAACGAALLAFTLLFSVFFVVSRADHDCGGEHCAICQQIRACQSILRQLSAARPAAARAALLCMCLLLPVQRQPSVIAVSSPVLLKVKLLN